MLGNGNLKLSPIKLFFIDFFLKNTNLVLFSPIFKYLLIHKHLN